MRTILSLSAAMVAAVAIGCGGAAAPSKLATDKATATKVAKSGDHGHGAEEGHGAGPHGGTIVEFGKLHAEFAVDHPKKQVTVYILSGDLKKAVAIGSDKLALSIKTPMFAVDLKPMPMEGEPKGISSRFVAVHDNFGKEQEFEGTISGEIDGKPYLGDFKEKAESHEHGKK